MENNDGEGEFYVEKVIHVRERDGKKEYLLKWRGYPESENSWEPLENIYCKDLVEQFEKERREKRKIKHLARMESGTSDKHNAEDRHGIEEILGTTKVNGKLQLLVKLLNEDKVEYVPIDMARKRFPKLVINFFEKHLQ